MNPIIARLRGWFLAATPAQRIGTIGGGALAVLTIALVASFASKPRYTLLYGGLSPSDQANVVSEMQARGIPVRYDAAGTVEVPEGKVADAKMQLATVGKIPKTGRSGSNDLAAINLYTTPAVERERLKSVLEGELVQSIETMPGVQSARVHLTLGDPSPFGDQRRPATASVNIQQGGTGLLTGEQSRGIAMLVANAVDGLELKNVVVLNERMEPLFNGADGVGSEGVAQKKVEMERLLSRSEERRLQGLLDGMFGPGSTVVAVRAEVDLDEEESTVVSHKVKDGAEVESAKERMPVDGSGAPPVPAGFAANGGAAAPAAAPTPTGGKGEYTNEVKRIEPGTVDTQIRRKKATGGLKRMVINVAANVGRFKDPAEGESFVASVRQFVQNEFADQTDTASFKALVTAVKFDTSQEAQALASQAEASSLARRQQLISLLPIAALLVVGGLVVRTLGKMARPATPFAIGPDGAAIPLGPGGAPLLPPGRVGSAGDPSRGPAALEAALGDHAAGPEGGIEFESDDERIRISKIKERTSIPLEQIKQMSIERPEAVALLVKSWLMETPAR